MGSHQRLLSECAPGIADSLSALFNKSFTSGTLPGKWKQALIVPVFKRGDKHQPTNYRPISLLSAVGKVQGRIVYNKLYSFLKSTLSPYQSGFCKNDNTGMQLIRLTQSWAEILNASTLVGVVFFDLTNAFGKG